MTLVSFAQTCAEQFVELDVNQDGFISPEEASASALVSSLFSAIDSNADGAISLEEWAFFCS